MTVAIRETYPLIKLKYAVELRRARVEGADSDKPYIGLENIESGTGRLVPAANTQAPEGDFASAIGDSLSAVFQSGDILFGKLRPYLAKAWIANFDGRCSTELLPLRPYKVDPRFGLYVVLSRPFIDAVDASTFGSKMPRADWEFIGSLTIPLPALHQQRNIARFLDSETLDIDTLIAAKQRLLDLLAEKRRAIVAEAIMRGLDPAAPTRPTGIDWLGDIPTHWKIKRSKWLFQERDERSTDGSEVLLSLRMERGLVPHNDVSEKKTLPEELVGYKKISTGQLVVNRMRAATGLIAIAQQDGLVSPDYAVFLPSEDISADYYVELFKTPLLQAVFRSESTGLGTGSQGFLRLYSQNFLALWFPNPPLEEQYQIVRHVRSEWEKIDRLRAATDNSIALLKERRSALIAAAVTGQTDIPEATA